MSDKSSKNDGEGIWECECGKQIQKSNGGAITTHLKSKKHKTKLQAMQNSQKVVTILNFFKKKQNNQNNNACNG